MDEFEFFKKILKLIENENILKPNKEKVIEYLEPNKLKDVINLSLTDDNCVDNLNELETICKLIIRYSIKTNSRNFHNQLYGGTDLFGLSGTILSESLNTNQHTFEVAPVFTLIEQTIIEQIKLLIGYHNESDGIFSPGGSISNMYGMVLARFKFFPQIKSNGFSNLPVLVAFTSEDSHYSIQKAANWLGIGTNNLIKIKTDNYGRMIPEELKKHIIENRQKGYFPFFVNATAGTTVLGAFDPLNEIADICHDFNLWLHIDACYGGTLLLSDNYKYYLNGCDRSDSFAWNPHKMLGAPLQCSLFLTKHKNILHECNSTSSAVYLFQQDKFYDISYDTGNKSIQCGRKIDCFKLWLMWKARRLVGFQELIDNAIDCSKYLQNKIQTLDNFRLVQDIFEASTVCFWYIPEKLRGKEENLLWWQEINKVAPLIKEKLTRTGSLMIGYMPLNSKGYCNFFRMVTTCHPKLNYSDMDYVIEQIKIFGERL